MNPLLVKFILGTLRRVLQSSGLLLTVSDTDLTEFIVAAATAVGFLWGWWNDFKEQRKLTTALATPGITTQAHVENLIKEGRSASALTPKDEYPERRM